MFRQFRDSPLRDVPYLRPHVALCGGRIDSGQCIPPIIPPACNEKYREDLMQIGNSSSASGDDLLSCRMAMLGLDLNAIESCGGQVFEAIKRAVHELRLSRGLRARYQTRSQRSGLGDLLPEYGHAHGAARGLVAGGKIGGRRSVSAAPPNCVRRPACNRPGRPCAPAPALAGCRWNTRWSVHRAAP